MNQPQHTLRLTIHANRVAQYRARLATWQRTAARKLGTGLILPSDLVYAARSQQQK